MWMPAGGVWRHVGLKIGMEMSGVRPRSDYRPGRLGRCYQRGGGGVYSVIVKNNLGMLLGAGKWGNSSSNSSSTNSSISSSTSIRVVDGMYGNE